MAIEEILMPNLGESVVEATVVNWLVQPGDKIDRYQPLMEVISDKVTTEIPSDFAGEVKELIVELDKSVPIGTVLMTLETADSVSVVKTDESSANIDSEKPTNIQQESADTSRYSPAVMRIAQEKGIDLNLVTGTGRGGRITRKDLVDFAETPQINKREITSAEEIKVTPVAPQIAERTQTADRTEIIEADGVRKAIATKMVQSKTEIPHAWVMIEVDVSNVVKLRNEGKAEFMEKEGHSLSYFPFFIKAVVLALKQNPKINTSWDNGKIIYHKDINLSIAVTTDDNLFVPVIHQADQYSLTGLAKKVNELAVNVRNKTLSSQAMQGGTFTINNTGSIGAVQSMGIINYPQAAILQVESIIKRVVPSADGGIKTADMVNLSLSIDHRILDGKQAGKFLADIKNHLATFSKLTDLY